MKCPVCQTTILNNESTCHNCGFADLYREFINRQDAQDWELRIVVPYREKWKVEQETKTYLIHGQYYERIKDLRSYLSEAPDDIRATVEYVGLLCATLFESKYPMKKGEPEYIAKQCISIISNITINADDSLSRYRKIRLQYICAIMNMILGELCKAYDIFCTVAKDLEQVSKDTMNRFTDAAEVLFRAEINIHQLKEMVGIDDSDFFRTHKHEISFFERFSKIIFTHDGSLCLSVLLPLMGKKSNPIYDIEDSKGNFVVSFGYGGMYHGMLYGMLGYSNVLTYRYWPINLFSNASSQQCQEWTWRVEIKDVNRKAIRAHFETHPYEKEEGYLATLIARADAQKQ